MENNFAQMSPAQVRALIREGKITQPTTGMCDGYAQGNLVVLPKELAWDFLLFCQRNPKSCPLLEVADAGSRTFPVFGAGSDIARDIPKYRVYENGVMTGEYTDVSKFFDEPGRELVSFLIGCSFSFESELLDSGITVRHIEEHKNVPMYLTNIDCEPAGVFSGKMVVSMRPLPRDQIVKAVNITSSMPRVHGTPIQIGHPEQIGISDINKPDFGDAVTVKPGETPVFWACGVTPQSIMMNSKPDFCITHAPGHMLITDIKNTDLKF